MSRIEKIRGIIQDARYRSDWTLKTSEEIAQEIDDYYCQLFTQQRRTKMRPRIVTLCGSTRFKDQFVEANLKETLAGKMVFTIGCDMKTDREIFEHLQPEKLRLIKAGLDILHFHKIAISDEILVLNVGGYIGESTEREIEYAKSCGVDIRYLEQNSD